LRFDAMILLHHRGMRVLFYTHGFLVGENNGC
jgi:hypothetical protein